MKLTDRKVQLIVVLTVIALSGLVILQTVLLNTALKSEEETFKAGVSLAMSNAIQELSQKEARNAILKISFDEECDSIAQPMITIDTIGDESIDTLYYLFQGDSLDSIKSGHISQSFEYRIMDIESERQITSTDSIKRVMAITISDGDTVLKEKVTREAAGFEYDFKQIGDSVMYSHHFFPDDSNRVMLIEAALGQLDRRAQVPILKRIDTTLLDSILGASFNEADIELDYSFGIKNNQDSLIFISPEADTATLSTSLFSSRLFPYDLIPQKSALVVFFPNKQFYILSQLGTIVLPTVVFLLIITGCFIYTIRTILNQRQTAQKLNDFINNMTHELKTPIATIHLAAEGLARADVQTDPEKTKQFNNMILSENRRMKTHVDKILQIATLEEGDYILNFELVHAHELLEEMISAFQLRVQEIQGEIVPRFNATTDTLSADMVHLTNIITNVIDNALKYSSEHPSISITTENSENTFILRVKDSGIGIHPDDLKKVFVKYYRVAGGDIHDTKGFGLGLAYVKMMTQAHQGDVEISSVLGKGTEVTLTFPIMEAASDA